MAQRRGASGAVGKGCRPLSADSQLSDLGAQSPCSVPHTLAAPPVSSCFFPPLLPALGRCQPLAVALTGAPGCCLSVLQGVHPLCPCLVHPRHGRLFPGVSPHLGLVRHRLSGTSPAGTAWPYQSLGPCPFQPESHESRPHLQWSLQGPSAPHGGDTCSQKGSDLRLRPRSEKTYPDKGLQTCSLTQKAGQTWASLLLRSPTETTAEGSEAGKNPQGRIGLEGRPTGGGSHIPVGGHRVGRAGESAPSCMVQAAETGSCPS